MDGGDRDECAIRGVAGGAGYTGGDGAFNPVTVGVWWDVQSGWEGGPAVGVLGAISITELEHDLGAGIGEWWGDMDGVVEYNRDGGAGMEAGAGFAEGLPGIGCSVALCGQ